MIQLIYMSAASREFALSELRELLAKARENNQRLGLTGMLVYQDRSFMQVLEGDETAVMQLYDRIGQDGRHFNVTTLLRTHIERRSFADWSMGFFNADEQELASLPGFSQFFGEHFSKHLFASHPSLAKKLLLEFRQGSWRQFVDGDRAVASIDAATCAN